MNELDTGLNKLARDISEWRESKEFYTPDSIAPTKAPIEATHGDMMLGKLALVGEEVGELVSAVRKNDISNFEEEVADIMIRLLDICGTMKIDIESAIREKMEVNRNRPSKHGKLTSI